MARTGRFRFREGWFGNQILEVEITSRIFTGAWGDGYIKREWIKGTKSDAIDVIDKLNGRIPVPPECPNKFTYTGPMDPLKMDGPA